MQYSGFYRPINLAEYKEKKASVEVCNDIFSSRLLSLYTLCVLAGIYSAMNSENTLYVNAGIHPRMDADMHVVTLIHVACCSKPWSSR
jgi:hypothetical protein